MTVKYNFALNNDALPLYSSLGTQILAIASLTEWFQAQQESLVVSGGKIATWNSKKASARTFTQATGSKQADLLTNQINGWAAADFPHTALQHYGISANPTLTGALTWVIIVKPELNTTPQGLICSLTDASNRCGFDIAGTDLGQAFVGNGIASFPVTINSWQVIWFEKDATTLRVRYQGTTSAAVAHNNLTGSANIKLGAISPDASTLDAKISDVLMFNAKVLDDTNIVGLIADFAREVYGISAA